MILRCKAQRASMTDCGTRAREVLDRLRLGDTVFRLLTRAAAIGVLVILGGVIFSLVDGSLPALRAFGFNFLIEERWNPVTEKFGALAPIYGTLVTSFIAMLIAVPVGLLIAVFLTELCPHVAAAADRHRHRAAWPASRASSTASGACSCSRRSCRRPCSRS